MKHLHVFLSGWTTTTASTLGQKMLKVIANQMCFTAKSVVYWANNDRNNKCVACKLTIAFINLRFNTCMLC